MGKREGRRPLEGPKRRWEDNVNTDLRRLVFFWGVGGMYWIDLAQHRDG